MYATHSLSLLFVVRLKDCSAVQTAEVDHHLSAPRTDHIIGAQSLGYQEFCSLIVTRSLPCREIPFGDDVYLIAKITYALAVFYLEGTIERTVNVHPSPEEHEKALGYVPALLDLLFLNRTDPRAVKDEWNELTRPHHNDINKYTQADRQQPVSCATVLRKGQDVDKSEQHARAEHYAKPLQNAIRRL